LAPGLCEAAPATHEDPAMARKARAKAATARRKRRPSRARLAWKPITSDDLTYDDLAAIERTEPRDGDRPKALPLARIEVAPLVFQWRLPSYSDREANPDDEELQARGLMSALENEGQLDPLLVTPVGRRVFVVDGHHRLEAYHAGAWTKMVPVRWFEGDLRAAQLEAMRLNRKNKLRMTDTSRREAAWRLMKERKTNPDRALTWESITSVTGVSKGTLSNMYRVLCAHEADALKETWENARRLDWPAFTGNDEAVGEWLDAATRKMIKHLAGGPKLAEHPEVTARALAEISPELPGRLIAEWGEEAVEYVIERVRDELGDKAAEQIESLLSEGRKRLFDL
jgi:hypothetical protein